MDDKIIIPVKEYPTWIDCHVFKKNSKGEYEFLYREPYQKEYINIKTLKKIIRMDKTSEYIQKYFNALDMLPLFDETKNLIRKVHKMLNEDDVVM